MQPLNRNGILTSRRLIKPLLKMSRMITLDFAVSKKLAYGHCNWPFRHSSWVWLATLRRPQSYYLLLSPLARSLGYTMRHIPVHIGRFARARQLLYNNPVHMGFRWVIVDLWLGERRDSFWRLFVNENSPEKYHSMTS